MQALFQLFRSKSFVSSGNSLKAMLGVLTFAPLFRALDKKNFGF
jgi:hypothetical protein